MARFSDVVGEISWKFRKDGIKCSCWSCVKLVEVVVGVSLMKFCTMIDSVDGFVLLWRKGSVMLRHEVSFFVKLMMNPNCCMMFRPRMMS